MDLCLKKLYIYIMSLIDKVKTKDNQIQLDTLNLEEVDIIIRVLGGASFPVKEIEPLYRAIYKLQMLRNKLSNGT